MESLYPVLVDTNVFITIMKGDLQEEEKVKSFGAVYICPIVWSELYIGANRSANPERNIKKVRQALKRSNLMAIDKATARKFMAIKLDLMSKGNMIPENDIWIASCAIRRNVPLYTNDKHFKRITGLVLH